MKTFPWLLVLLCLASLSSLAQDSTAALTGATRQIKQNPVNKNSIVRDSAGKQYSYDAWRRLMISGSYKLTSNSHTPGEYLLKKLTPEEIAHRFDQMPKPAETNCFTTGQPVAQFKIKDMNGHPFNLKETKGKVVVLNFFFIDCPPCREEIPSLNTLVSDYGGNDNIVFLAIALDEKYALENFLQQVPFSFPVADDGKWLAQKLGIRGYPTHVVIGKDGNVLFHTAGGGPYIFYWLKKSIAQAMQG